MNQAWTIVIFVFNEESTIEEVIRKAHSFLAENSVPESELLVVDDGSNDNSQSIINKIKGSFGQINYVCHKTNLGIGQALLTGYRNAKCENVIAIPGDGQFDLNELKPHINFPPNHFISFYREENEKYSFYRRILTKANALFNKFILSLNIRDVNWVKAFKTSELQTLNLKLTSSLVMCEICSKLSMKGFKAIEVTSVYHARKGGAAKGGSLKSISRVFREIARLAFVVRKYKLSL